MGTKLMTAALMWATLGGCGGHWDLRDGVAVVYSNDIVGFGVDVAIQNAFSQLGTHINTLSNNKLHVSYRDTCSCSQCGPYTVAIAAPLSYTVYICPYAKTNPGVYVDVGIKHELLHTLAHRGDHLPCETGAMMTPDVACEISPGKYLDADFHYLCEGGYVSGGVCASVASLP